MSRDNPVDPGTGGGTSQESVRLRAVLPDSSIPVGRADSICYQVLQPGLRDTAILTAGTMNRVGGIATALVVGLPATRKGLRVRVDAYDTGRIATYSGRAFLDEIDPSSGTVDIALSRLTGEVELTSQLPPEIDTLEVIVAVDGDSLQFALPADGTHPARLTSIPTGAGVPLLLRGRDERGQVLVQQRASADIRIDLVARVTFLVQTGALEIVADFPDYIPVQEIDRFSDAAATLYRRTEIPGLPQANEAVDFDGSLFRYCGRGPDGETVHFYCFDAQSAKPAPMYQCVDRWGAVIQGQLPIFDRVPGEAGYSDLHRIIQVKILDPAYRPNSMTSFEAIQNAGYDTTSTDLILNAVLVPAGSRASLRLDAATPTELQDGWYKGSVAKYLLFEHPQSGLDVGFDGTQVTTQQMYAFFENDMDFTAGFARDEQTGCTHNIFTALPGGDADYSPLWQLRVLRLDVFPQVTNVATASTQVSENFHQEIDQRQILLNAPIVRVE